MTGLHKFSLKKLLHVIIAIAVVCAVTLKSNARRTIRSEIYSTLTTDTSKPQNFDTLFQKPITGSAAKTDTTKSKQNPPVDSLGEVADTTIRDTAVTQRVDTFSLRMSKDTLDAPVNYEAQDSAVVLVQEKKILLYGKTKTVYKEITLEAPKVEMDQQTDLVTAYNSRDSLGDVLERARMEQGAALRMV